MADQDHGSCRGVLAYRKGKALSFQIALYDPFSDLLDQYIAIVLHCIPVSAYWNKSIENATCGVNDRLFFMGTNTVNFAMDLVVLILPMPYIQKLQVKRSQKLVVFGMFTLGGL